MTFKKIKSEQRICDFCLELRSVSWENEQNGSLICNICKRHCERVEDSQEKEWDIHKNKYVGVQR